MNQDAVKAALLRLRAPTEDFSVLMTGKSSKRVNGFYRYEERTIYLHNKNFKDDTDLIYTAIHEYAHHLLICDRPETASAGARCHTQAFWSLFHSLLD